MIGIYKIINKINGHSYIGQSVDIERRIKHHFNNAFNNSSSNTEYDKTLYRAIRKYGKENFDVIILEECSQSSLNEREKYWIEYFDTFKNGYNETVGGDGIVGHSDERHPKTKLTNKDVWNIRECYKNHQEQKIIYQEYKDKIGESGFKKIWNGYTWKDIHMDVYTDENKNYYKFKRNSNSENNSHAKLKENDVYNIRLRKKNGEKCQDVYKDYTQLTYKSFQNVWYYVNWKHIIV